MSMDEDPSVRPSVCINVPCFIIGVHKSILKGFVNLTIKFLQKKELKLFSLLGTGCCKY